MPLMVAVVVIPRFLRRPLSSGLSCHCQNDCSGGHDRGQSVPHWMETRSSHKGLPQALFLTICVGLAERGQRRVEGPLSSRIKVGLDSFVDPDSLSLGGSSVEVKAITRLVFTIKCFGEHYRLKVTISPATGISLH